MNAAKAHERKRLYEFGAFRLDPAERLLARDGRRVPLAPKVFDTLLILVESSGRVLTKEQLIETLWPDSFVEENNLTQHISALRRALGNGNPHISKNVRSAALSGSKDPSDEQEYIETVPKLGYRFVVPVRETGADDAELVISRRTRTHIVLREEQVEEEVPDPPVNPGPSTSSTPAPGKTAKEPALSERRGWDGRSAAVWRRTVPVVIGAVSVLLLLSAAIYRFWFPPKAPAASVGTRGVAVLPLRNLRPDPETDFLSMALSDAIINRLGYASELNVEPLSSVAKYKNTNLDAREIARALNVQSVLTGSYLKEGDQLRVTTELISVADGAGLRRDNIELKYEKLFSLQDRVAISVIHSLGLELQPDEAERLNQGMPTNPAAYEYYLRGTDAGFNSDGKTAIQLLEKSVALEPANAMAWYQLGTVYLGYGTIQGGDSRYNEKGWQALHHASELDPKNRLIVDAMAFQLLEHNRADEAVPLLEESLRRNPSDSFAHWYLSEADRYGGALEQSVAEGELALKLNPNVARNLTFNTYLYLGQYQKFLDSLPRDENNARTVFYRGLAYYYLSDRQKAVEEFSHAYALNPSLLHAQIGRALAYGLQDQGARGLNLMAGVERAGSDDGEMLYKMAQASAQLGDQRNALRLVRKSIELNFYPYAYFARDPLLEPVRSDPEYPTVMEMARQNQETFRKRLQ